MVKYDRRQINLQKEVPKEKDKGLPHVEFYGKISSMGKDHMMVIVIPKPKHSAMTEKFVKGAWIRVYVSDAPEINNI